MPRMMYPRAASAVAPELLERQEQLDVLIELFDGVVHDGRGRLALVYAEAGLGKTSLLRLLCKEQADAARVLWGACEPMSAPRPLGG